MILEPNSTLFLDKATSGETLDSLRTKCLAGEIRSALHGTAAGELRVVLVADDCPHPQTGLPAFRLSESSIENIDGDAIPNTVDDFNLAMCLTVADGPGFFVLTTAGKLAEPFIAD